MADADLEALLTRWTLGDKLQRLARLAPKDVRAIEEIADDALRHRWPTIRELLRRRQTTGDRQNH